MAAYDIAIRGQQVLLVLTALGLLGEGAPQSPNIVLLLMDDVSGAALREGQGRHRAARRRVSGDPREAQTPVSRLFYCFRSRGVVWCSR